MCVHVYEFTCVLVCVMMCVFTCVCVCVGVCECVCICVWACVGVCVDVCVSVCECTSVLVYVWVCIDALTFPIVSSPILPHPLSPLLTSTSFMPYPCPSAYTSNPISPLQDVWNWAILLLYPNPRQTQSIHSTPHPKLAPNSPPTRPIMPPSCPHHAHTSPLPPINLTAGSMQWCHLLRRPNPRQTKGIRLL